MRLARFVRGRWTLDRISYVLLAVFVLLTLGPGLVGLGTLFDIDGLSGLMPFAAQHGMTANDAVGCRWDTVNYYLPGIARIKDAFFAGDFPTWAPYEVGGTPLASLPNHAALSPLSLPYYLMPLWLAPAFVKLGEFAVAIGGMVLFLRRLGVSRGAERPGRHHLRHLRLHDDVDQLAAHPRRGVHPASLLGPRADRPAAASRATSC